jgi:ADP-heptose:LPS heptosyltransferase
VITWGPGEESLVEEIFRFCETDPPIAFSTTLHQFVSLVRRARLFVGGDTGPLHIAVGCGTPVVGIFGPTSPTRNGPLHPLDLVVSHKVPCGPCYKKTCEIYQKECMQLVTVEEVFEAILQRLKVETDLVVN